MHAASSWRHSPPRARLLAVVVARTTMNRGRRRYVITKNTGNRFCNVTSTRPKRALVVVVRTTTAVVRRAPSSASCSSDFFHMTILHRSSTTDHASSATMSVFYIFCVRRPCGRITTRAHRALRVIDPTTTRRVCAGRASRSHLPIIPDSLYSREITRPHHLESLSAARLASASAAAAR